MEQIKENIAIAIANSLDGNITKDEVLTKLEIPKDKQNGDFSYPCFNLSKLLKQSPINIANEIKNKIKLDSYISKVEVINGYLNFYINLDNISETVINNIISQKEKYGKLDIGKGRNIVLDYSSPNIAKPFHLGHFRNTVIGNAIYKLYTKLGYNVIGINYLGDWGRQFGLLIEGYKRFKDEFDIENDALNALSKIYVKISNLAKSNEDVMNLARQNFKELEDGNEEYLKLWEYFRNVSLKEYNRIYDMLGCKFDSYNGEAFYNDKMGEVVDILNNKGVLVESEGAKVVFVGDNMPPCIILKSNGSTTYETRDFASILYRVRNYDFDKAIYVTGSDQILHFKQVFEVAKYLVDEKYVKNLVHIPYGMVRLKTGKMSTREGTVIELNNLLNEAIQKAKNIIEEKNNELEDKEIVAKQVGIGALVFNYLKTNKIKDMIFDLDESLRFDGETGPYVQYTYVRAKSLLNKADFDINKVNISDIDFSIVNTSEETELIKNLDKFSEVIKRAADQYEPAVLARYLVEVATCFSRMYNECPILSAENNIKIARLYLVCATSIVIKNGLEILGIESPEKM